MEKRSQHSYFPVNIVKFLRTPIWKNICERLLQSLETYMTYNKNNPAFMNNLRRGKTAHSHKSLVAAPALLVLHVCYIDYSTAQIEVARKSLIRWQAREIQQYLHSNIYIYCYYLPNTTTTTIKLQLATFIFETVLFVVLADKWYAQAD